MKKLIRHEVLVFFGIILVVGTLIKLVGHVDIDSDWFWFFTGVAITIEGMINLVKQKQFDRKYKVVVRED